MSNLFSISVCKPSRFTLMTLVLSKILTSLHQWLLCILSLTPPLRKLQPGYRQTSLMGDKLQAGISPGPQVEVCRMCAAKPWGTTFILVCMYNTRLPIGCTWWPSLPSHQQGRLQSFLMSNRKCGRIPQCQSPFLPSRGSVLLGLWLRKGCQLLSWDCPHTSMALPLFPLCVLNTSEICSTSIALAMGSLSGLIVKSCYFFQNLVFPNTP